MLDALHNLSLATLRTLAASLRDGPLTGGVSRHALAQVVGPQAAAIHENLDELKKQGMSGGHIALMLEAIAETRERAADPRLLFELVLSGPEVPGVPTADTAATLQTLIENAQTEILLIGYAVHNGKRLFRRLAERMESVPPLRVVFCLDIARKPADTSLASEIVRRFAREFVTKHWPGARLPEVLYDPRALAERWEDRASLHAKCVIVDGHVALITSANFTEAAQRKNIETGVLVRYEPIVKRLHSYITSLHATAALMPCPLNLPPKADA